TTSWIRSWWWSRAASESSWGRSWPRSASAGSTRSSSPRSAPSSARGSSLSSSSSSSSGGPPALSRRRGAMPTLEKSGLVAAALILVVLLPALNALPATQPFHVSNFTLNLFGKFLAYAILALGLDLIWGYTGVLSLGHGVFFGLGA